MGEKKPLINIEVPPASSSDRVEHKSVSTENMPEVPERYYENKLVLLPVNAHTQHFYWDIGDEQLEGEVRNHVTQLVVRLYYVSQGRRFEVESVYSSSAHGNYYAYHTPDTKEMEAVLFAQSKAGEKEVAVSNRISTPSSGMHSSPWEIWMTKNGKTQKLESRPSDLETPDALTNPSSLDLVLRAEKLRARLGDMNPSDFLSSVDSSPPRKKS
ncbi:MAG: DUF4912 domain-containing protein [Helicobacteraceae bacterium]|jgi:hypothetical protein|nr:DUF4912 domain-containing protein [Helicobacteraceae bacterium]